MTSRERLVAAARGGETDQRPAIVWPGSGMDSDALVVAVEDVRSARESSPDVAVLAEIANPYWIAFQRNLELKAILDSDPLTGDALLSQVVDEVRDRIDVAMASGADGILYRLHGATPRHSTPMAYGGFYLDRDRALLEAVEDATFNLVYVVGERGAYLDFVSDLPAHAFGWDVKESGIPVSEVRAMRTGAVAADDPDADIQLRSMVENITGYLEAQTIAGV